MSTMILKSRLKHELKDIKNNPNLSLYIDENNPNIWFISFKGAKDSLYENEQFKLKFELQEGYVFI